LLYGPPGTGKTSIILALVKEIFGPQHYKERILELNASDDRGIQKVREKIKKYAETKLTKLPKSYPSFKIIILDEADQMTPDAQNALRRVMEDYSNITRFCLICNYVTKIIEPLNSRCVKFRFKQIPIASQIEQLTKICKKEEIDIKEDAVEGLINISDGDLRKSVNLLQLAKSSFATKSLTYKDIMKISDV
jgi:replication factor C subunit 2/4